MELPKDQALVELIDASPIPLRDKRFTWPQADSRVRGLNGLTARSPVSIGRKLKLDFSTRDGINVLRYAIKRLASDPNHPLSRDPAGLRRVTPPRHGASP